VVVIGERKNYLTLLLNLDYDIAAQIAKANGIEFGNSRDLAKNAAFLKIIDKYINELNADLAKYETIKKYKILEKDFSQEGGELTVSLKVKRNVVHAKYSAIIDEMYAGEK
jgi:long-chain acyl-CoA synthetase